MCKKYVAKRSRIWINTALINECVRTSDRGLLVVWKVANGAKRRGFRFRVSIEERCLSIFVCYKIEARRRS